MRLFIAVEFSIENQRLLEEWMGRARQQGVRGNFTKKENLHMTLRFLGEQPDGRPIQRAMREAAEKCQAFELLSKGTGTFRDVFWMGFDEEPRLKLLVQKLGQTLEEQGFGKEERRFQAHMTLCRRFDQGEGGLPDLPKIQQAVRWITLMESRRGPNGILQYHPLCQVTLQMP